MTKREIIFCLNVFQENEAFFDDTVYRVSGSPKKEKMTEL